MNCVKCGKEIPRYATIDGFVRKLVRRKHCLDCVPFGSHGGGRMPLDDTSYKNCLNCGKKLTNRQTKYCSNQCQHDYHYKVYIDNWKNGINSGTKGEAWIDVSGFIKRYIFEKYNYKCARCGWAEINPFTKTLPLEIEHIDGDATNNEESNLVLLCPNCHSLTKTYRGANKGNGVRDIKWLSRKGKTTNSK